MDIFFHLTVLANSSSDSFSIDTPSNNMSPETISPPDTDLMIASPSVLFPQALSPTMPIDSLLSRRNDTPSTALTVLSLDLYCTLRSFIESVIYLVYVVQVDLLFEIG